MLDIVPYISRMVKTGVRVGRTCGRAVKSLGSNQEVPGSNPGSAKSWAVMELLVNIYLCELSLCLLCV